MAVSVHGKVHKLRVSPGPEGKEAFRRQVQALLGSGFDADFDVVFEAKVPHTGEKVQLHGFGAFDAATHCAAISAAQRQQSKRRRPAAAPDARSRAADSRTSPAAPAAAALPQLAAAAAASGEAPVDGAAARMAAPDASDGHTGDAGGDFSGAGHNGHSSVAAAAAAWPLAGLQRLSSSVSADAAAFAAALVEAAGLAPGTGGTAPLSGGAGGRAGTDDACPGTGEASIPAAVLGGAGSASAASAASASTLAIPSEVDGSCVGRGPAAVREGPPLPPAVGLYASGARMEASRVPAWRRLQPSTAPGAGHPTDMPSSSGGGSSSSGGGGSGVATGGAAPASGEALEATSRSRVVRWLAPLLHISKA